MSTATNERYPHGTRAKHHVERCRCLLCRAANSNYETERQRRKREGSWQPYTAPAEIAKALRHIERLRAAGIGLRQIARAAGLNRKVIRELVYPERRPQRGRPAHRRPRRESVQKILAVTTGLRDRAGAAFIPAAKTWQLIGILKSAGYPQRRLAFMLGYRAPALQFRKHRLEVRTARKVARLFKQLWLKDARVRQLSDGIAPADWQLALAMA